MSSRASVAVLLCVACLYVLPATVHAQANVKCILEHCAMPSIECGINTACRSAMMCEKGCGTNQTCMVMCEMEHPSSEFDTLSQCLLKNHCFEPQPPVACPNPPPMRQFNVATDLSGEWWVVRGLSPAYDCFACSTMDFGMTSTPGLMAYNWTIKVPSPTAGGQGFMHSVMCNVTQNTTQPARLIVQYFTAGIPGEDHWSVLAMDAAPAPVWMLVHYCGSTPVWNYEGGIVISRTKQLTPYAEAAIKAETAKVGIDYSSWCTIDNAQCPQGRAW